MQPTATFRKGRNNRKLKSSSYDCGSRKKSFRDADTIPEVAEFDELHSPEFGMNGDNFMLPVFFYNLKGFYSLIIISYIDKNFAPSDTQLIPTKSEKYIFFSNP